MRHVLRFKKYEKSVVSVAGTRLCMLDAIRRPLSHQAKPSRRDGVMILLTV